MSNITVSKRVLQIGTGVIWGAVLIGVSLFTEAEQGGNLDWELMWIIVGGFLVQSALINFYIKDNKNE